MADFVVEFTQGGIEGNSSLNQVHNVGLTPTPPWKVYANEASNSQGFKLGVVLISPEGIALEWSIILEFLASNNKAEYEALLSGLQMAKQVRATKVKIYCNSRLVTNQVNG